MCPCCGSSGLRRNHRFRRAACRAASAGPVRERDAGLRLDRTLGLRSRHLQCDCFRSFWRGASDRGEIPSPSSEQESVKEVALFLFLLVMVRAGTSLSLALRSNRSHRLSGTGRRVDLLHRATDAEDCRVDLTAAPLPRWGRTPAGPSLSPSPPGP